MNTTAFYDEICQDIWQFYEDNLPGLSKAFCNAKSRLASPWMPPPPDRCGSPVGILFIGLSPKLLDDYPYADSLEKAKMQAREYRYVTAGESEDIWENYDPYYSPLLKRAENSNRNCGVWHQIKSGKKKSLVEFSDFCHFPAIAHTVLSLVYAQTPGLREHCRKILEREITLYQPSLVVVHGEDTALDIWDMHYNAPYPGFEQWRLIKSFLDIKGCNVLLSKFLVRDLQEETNKNRLTAEFQRIVMNLGFLPS